MKAIFLCLLVVLALACIAHAEQPSEEQLERLQNDLPYMKCSICEKNAKNLFKMANQLTKEEKIYEVWEPMIMQSCNPNSIEGSWISYTDIVVRGKKLALLEEDLPSMCGEECNLLSYGCQMVFGSIIDDVMEVIEDLTPNSKEKDFVNKICKKTTKSCKKKTPKMPAKYAKQRKELDEEFVVNENRAKQMELMEQEKRQRKDMLARGLTEEEIDQLLPKKPQLPPNFDMSQLKIPGMDEEGNPIHEGL